MRQRLSYAFGPFELDVANHRLTRGGRVVALQSLPFKVLASLVSRAGELVPREDLSKELWGESFVDAEQGLNTAVRKVRRALGDSPAAPTYVETVRGHGYRFLAEVGVRRRPAAGPAARAAALYGRGWRAAVPLSAGLAGLLLAALGLQPPEVRSAAALAVRKAAAAGEECDEETLRIAVRPLEAAVAVAGRRRLGQALAEDVAGALWSVDERRLAAFRTWEADVDQETMDYLLGGRVRASSTRLLIELTLRPTRGDGESWSRTIEVPAAEPFLYRDRVGGLIEHLLRAEPAPARASRS